MINKGDFCVAVVIIVYHGFIHGTISVSKLRFLE